MMRGAGHARPVNQGAAGGGNSTPFRHFCKECDRKVRFEDKGRSTGVSYGAGGSVATAKQLKEKVAEKPRSMTSRSADAGGLKDKQTGAELPTFGAQQQALHQGQDTRLRGKLKWLFEQDRMFWESNSAKSSLRGSPEVDRSRSLSAASSTPSGNLSAEYLGDAKLVHAEDSFGRPCSSRKPPVVVHQLKPPRQQQLQTTDKAMVSRRDRLSNDRSANSSSTKTPWTFSTSTAKFWPRAKAKAQQSANNGTAPTVESKGRAAPKKSPVDPTKRVKASESATLMSREEILSDYDDAPKSGESSETTGSSDEEDAEEMRKKVDGVIARGGDGSLQDVKNQAAYLKVKCDMLSKEKEHALRKWKKSCQEIDDAAKMAQALRSAIEALLEASATDSRTDFKARKDILEDQTEALKMRMDKLRRKNSEGLLQQPQVKPPSVPLDDRVQTLKKTAQGRSLASPEIPRDTQYKIEALRARLERLMLATNSRVSGEQRQPPKSARERKKSVEDWLRHLKPHPDEKAELKMKGWLNSLSAELTSATSPDTSTGTCDKCSGASRCPTPFISKQATPSTSKQESPSSSTHDRGRDGPGSAPSSEETKKNVIHKIAEEVQMEAEQWFQVQELLGRVGEDMNSIQEACSTWEKRAILAEAQVVSMHSGHEKKDNTTPQIGDEKIAELQKEMVRLRETVDDVKKQIGNINIDPSRWFEAAQNFGYAFMPVNQQLGGGSCGCKSTSKHFSCDKGTTDSSDQWREVYSASADGKPQPSCSGNTSTTSSTICSSEKMPADNEGRQRAHIPSQQWAKEIAKAEEDEILTTANATGKVPKLEFPNSTVKEVSSASAGKLLEKTAKLSHKDLGLETSGSRGDMILQMQASIRERCNSILQQEEQHSRYSNITASRRPRSPLRDVLENITSSKENKRPY